MNGATHELTDLLCTQCGLCCNGTLFADVELKNSREAAAVEDLGLEIDEGDENPVLSQPCAALHGRRCSIYEHRPSCCRTFECQLLTRTRQGDVDTDQAADIIAGTLDLVERVRDLLQQLERHDDRLPIGEQVQEALSAFEVDEEAFETRLLRVELQNAMAHLERRIRVHFTNDA